MSKPRLSFWQIWNMSFGFLGIQFGWGLQMGNMSAIYKFLGVSSDEIPMLWLAAPLTGLIVQPIIGYLSDRTWTGLGRRRPFFLVGAILSSIALLIMPNSSVWWMAAGTLWILDASINISMEPFRAFVADMLPEEQRTRGFAMQSVFIGLGAVLASALPIFLTEVVGVSTESSTGAIPPQVKISFYVGAAAFLGAVLWTVFTTKEYPPEDMEAFEKEKAENKGFFSGAGEIVSSIVKMPVNMRRLAVVQFFTWLSLFLMWIYFFDTISSTVFQAKDYPGAYTAYYNAGNTQEFSQAFFSDANGFLDKDQLKAIEEHSGSVKGLETTLKTEFGSLDGFVTEMKSNKEKLSDAVNWGNVCFGFYSLVTFFFGFLLPQLSKKLTRRYTHLLCLGLGGIGLIMVFFITNKWLLLISMAGVGLAWTSILTIPYSLLSTSIPEKKMGVYMGIFNFFIVLPEIIAALGFGWFLNSVLGGDKILALVVGGACMIFAGLLTLWVKESASE